MASETLLDLSQVRSARQHFQRAYDPTALGPAAEDYRLVGPVTLAFDIFKSNREFRLTGRLQAAIELPCGRCLEPFAIAIDEPFDLMYLPHSANTGQGEIEIEEDDLETAYYSDEVIDLGHMMHEQFYLALPMKPLCTEACRGLCPQCGINLNHGRCDCAPAWTDPRLEVLRGLIPPSGEPSQ